MLSLILVIQLLGKLYRAHKGNWDHIFIINGLDGIFCHMLGIEDGWFTGRFEKLNFRDICKEMMDEEGG